MTSIICSHIASPLCSVETRWNPRMTDFIFQLLIVQCLVSTISPLNVLEGHTSAVSQNFSNDQAWTMRHYKWQIWFVHKHTQLFCCVLGVVSLGLEKSSPWHTSLSQQVQPAAWSPKYDIMRFISATPAHYAPKLTAIAKFPIDSNLFRHWSSKKEQRYWTCFRSVIVDEIGTRPKFPDDAS